MRMTSAQGPRIAGNDPRPQSNAPGQARDYCTRIQYSASSDPIRDFSHAMAANGVICAEPERIEANGKIVRFRCEGDKRHTRNGWAVLHLDPIPAGAYGDHKRQITGKWCGGKSVPDDRRQKALRQARAESDAKRECDYKDAANRARELWNKAKPASNQNPYLVRKGILPHSARQQGHLLVIPLRDSSGALWSLQYIDGDGSKRYLKGGKAKGAYVCIGGPVAAQIAVCEGFATGATIYEQTGIPTACALSANNLTGVAQALRLKYPQADIVVCGDNDKSGVGQREATRAARAVRGRLAIPEVSR